MTRFDPITMEIIKNALSALADEMALVILRSAHSPIVRDSMDYSSTICDRDGDTIAQGLTNPVHLGSFPYVMRNIAGTHKVGMRQGDLFLVNDPYGGGGMHLPDVFLIKPIYVDGDLEGYAASVVHHADLGGIAPGSMGLQATEIHQEGLRIPLVKLREAGVENSTVMSFLEANSRMPTELRGDLGAQIASVEACERGLVQLVRKYGSARFRGYLDELHDYAERLMRQALSRMPPGEYDYTDHLDGLGEPAEPIRFQVKITIGDGKIVVDWTGTAKQVKGAINGPVPITYSVALAAIRAAIGAGIPDFAGYMRPLQLIAPPGSIVNPKFPAACAARGVIAYRMLDTLFGALAKVPGSRIPALGEGGPSVVSFSGRDEDKTWLITDGVLGSWGGRPSADGIDGIANPGANLSNQPVELIEARLPIKITRYGFAQDSGGGGEFRGGLAVVRSYEMTAPEGTLTLRSDRRSHLPAGVLGGLPGSPSLTFLRNAGSERLLPVMPMETISIERGAALVHIAAGAGGRGDPLDRDADRVLQDVLDDKISLRYAREIHGVIVLERERRVDEQATSALRAAMRAEPADLLQRQNRLFLERNGSLRLCLQND